MKLWFQRVMAILLLSLTLLNPFLGLNKANAGWLDIPNNIDAKGLITQFISQYSPTESVDYETNIKELLKIFKWKDIYNEVKETFTNMLVANIHSKLNNDYWKTYWYARLSFTPEEEDALKEAWLYDALSNFEYIELDYDFLKEANVIDEADGSYNYFKDTLYPMIKGWMDIPSVAWIGKPKIVSVWSYAWLIIPKDYDNIKIFFDDYYPKLKDYLIPLGLPWNKLLFISIPKEPNLSGQIVSNLTIDQTNIDYLVKWKIKYPKELEPCMSAIDGWSINVIWDLSAAMQSTPECKSLLTDIALDCSWEKEFIWEFNHGSANQFIWIYGLEEKDDMFWVVVIKREFSRKLIYALPSSTYDSSNNCGYNLLMADLLSKNVAWISDYSAWTKKLIYSSRNPNQGWNVWSCGKCSVDGTDLVCDSSSNNIADACTLYSAPSDFVSAWNDLSMNFWLYQTWSLTQNFLWGLKDSGWNIQNYWVAWKNLWNATIDKWLETQSDLWYNFNNSRYEAWNTIPVFWNNYSQIWEDTSARKRVNHKVRQNLIYDYYIDGANSWDFITSIIDKSNFTSIGWASSYDKPNFNRYQDLFVFSSGSSVDDTSRLNFLDLGSNYYTKFYIFAKKTTTEWVETLNLNQTLNLEGFAFFNADIGLSDYNTGDGLNWLKFSMSWSLDFLDNTLYTWNPTKIGTDKIDFDVLRYNYGDLANWLWTYKEIKHFKLVYDKSKDSYVMKDSDVWPFTSMESVGFNVWGLLGGILKDCSLANFVSNDLEGCSHNQIQPLNIDNDKVNIWNGYIDWDEWVYSTGAELRIFNNKVTKDNIWNYEIELEEIFYNNKLSYCNKEYQDADYYKNHDSDANALEVTEGSHTYKWYSPDYTKGLSLIFKQGDYKFIYWFDGNSWLDKKYSLTQLIEDTDNTITCE